MVPEREFAQVVAILAFVGGPNCPAFLRIALPAVVKWLLRAVKHSGGMRMRGSLCHAITWSWRDDVISAH